MSDNAAARQTAALQHQRALSRWDNEGGAQPYGLQTTSQAAEGQPAFLRMPDIEFQALHVRVIALESLVIALLAAASDRELKIAGKMASYILPRPGFTQHPLTLHAASHMTDLVERAARFSKLT